MVSPHPYLNSWTFCYIFSPLFRVQKGVSDLGGHLVSSQGQLITTFKVFFKVLLLHQFLLAYLYKSTYRHPSWSSSQVICLTMFQLFLQYNSLTVSDVPAAPVFSSAWAYVHYAYTWQGWSSDSHPRRQLSSIFSSSGLPSLFPSILQYHKCCHSGSCTQVLQFKACLTKLISVLLKIPLCLLGRWMPSLPDSL